MDFVPVLLSHCVLFGFVFDFHMIQRELQGHANELVAGAVGFSGKLVVLLLQSPVDSDGHGDRPILLRCDNEFLHAA